jgi:hypothetical protein
MQDHPGTEAALRAEVDLIDDHRDVRDISARIADLERFWRQHPGTSAGAEALARMGVHTGVNLGKSYSEPAGSDPTERFLRVVEIARELETGSYAGGPWAARAAGLVTGFFVSPSAPTRFAPGNADRMLAAYHQFVLSHWDAAPPHDPDSGVGYVVTSNLIHQFLSFTSRVITCCISSSLPAADRSELPQPSARSPSSSWP